MCNCNSWSISKSKFQFIETRPCISSSNQPVDQNFQGNMTLTSIPIDEMQGNMVCMNTNWIVQDNAYVIKELGNSNHGF